MYSLYTISNIVSRPEEHERTVSHGHSILIQIMYLIANSFLINIYCQINYFSILTFQHIFVHLHHDYDAAIENSSRKSN